MRQPIPPDLRHRYLASDAVSNWANVTAGCNVNRGYQPHAKANPTNSTNSSGSQNPQDSPLSHWGWSSSSSEVWDALVTPGGRTDSMTSPINEGSSSPRFRMPLTIKPDTITNLHRQSQHIWSLTQDIDKVRKCLC